MELLKKWLRKPEREIAIHETLLVGICLAAAGGFLDAYTYTLRGGVFANAQTGNLVLLALRVAQGDWQGAFYYVIPVLAFFCGILLTETIKLRTSDRHFLLWQHFSLLVEMALLAVVGFLPLSVPDAVVNVTISFVCSVQVQSFRKTRGLPYATTMCTGNLRSAADCFSVFLFQKDPLALRSCLRYLLIIFCFCAGAAAGAGCSQWLGAGAVWLCCGALGLVFAVMALGKKALAQM